MRRIYDNNQTNATYADCFPLNTWKQERLLLYFHGQNETRYVRLYSNLHGTFLDPIAEYRLKADFTGIIDVTDYLRTYYPTGSGTLYLAQLADNEMEIPYGTITIPFTIAGLINPAEVDRPESGLLTNTLVMPPSRLLLDTEGNGIYAEFRPSYGTWAVSWVKTNGTSGSQAIEGVRMSIPANWKTFTIYDSNETTRRKTYMIDRPAQCDKKYCSVSWVSFTGIERRHTFEYMEHKIESANDYSLITPDNSFNAIKGREDSFTLFIDQLSEYDIWYYADILTSSRVLLYAGDFMDNDTPVLVTDSKITLPDGEAGTDGSLKIKIKLKRYDAVAM